MTTGENSKEVRQVATGSHPYDKRVTEFKKPALRPKRPSRIPIMFRGLGDLPVLRKENIVRGKDPLPHDTTPEISIFTSSEGDNPAVPPSKKTEVIAQDPLYGSLVHDVGVDARRDRRLAQKIPLQNRINIDGGKRGKILQLAGITLIPIILALFFVFIGMVLYANKGNTIRPMLPQVVLPLFPETGRADHKTESNPGAVRALKKGEKSATE